MSLMQDPYQAARRRSVAEQFQSDGQPVRFRAAYSDPFAEGESEWEVYPTGAMRRICRYETLDAHFNPPADVPGRLRCLAHYWRRLAERAEADLDRAGEWLSGRRPGMRWATDRYGPRPPQHSPAALAPIAEAARAARGRQAEAEAELAACEAHAEAAAV